MSSPYTQQVLKVIVAQVCQTIGWNSIQTTPLNLLGDILHRYLQELSQQTHRYSELYGRSEPNLDDVALAFRDLNINISDLDEYVSNVDPVPCAIDVPQYPVHRENHLNFLKPGSKEVVTRPVHVSEHLPPMYPEREDVEPTGLETPDQHRDDDYHSDHNNPKYEKHETDHHVDVFSSPDVTTPNGAASMVATTPTTLNGNIVGSGGTSATVVVANDPSRPRTHSETEVRLTREISSVMMTTSGFISPAREGKLPDAKTPIIQQQFDPPAAADATAPADGGPPLLAPLTSTTAVASLNALGSGASREPTSAVPSLLPSSSNPSAGIVPPPLDKPSGKKKKNAQDKKVAKDLFKAAKMAPMGPPPPKQMPSMAEPLYPPSNSPMAAIMQQQQQQQQQHQNSTTALPPPPPPIGMMAGDPHHQLQPQLVPIMAAGSSAGKPEKKQKNKDKGNAMAPMLVDATGTALPTVAPPAKLSKKKQKKQAEKNAAAMPWNSNTFPGIVPINPGAYPFAGIGGDGSGPSNAAPHYYGPTPSAQQQHQPPPKPFGIDEPLSIKTERPHTPDGVQSHQPQPHTSTPFQSHPPPMHFQSQQQASPLSSGLPNAPPATAFPGGAMHPLQHHPLAAASSLSPGFVPMPLGGGPSSAAPTTKASEKRKKNATKTSAKKDASNPAAAAAALLPPNLNLPEMTIFPIVDDVDGSRLGAAIGTQQQHLSHALHQPLQSPQGEQPLNMSMPKHSPLLPLQLAPPPPGLVPLSSPIGGSASGFSPTPMSSHMALLSPQQQHQMLIMNANAVAASAAAAAAMGKGKKEPKPKKVREKKPPKPRAKKPAKAGGEWHPIGVQPGGQFNDQPPPLSSFGAGIGPGQQMQQQMSPNTTKAAAAAAQRKLAGGGHLPPTLGNIDDAAYGGQFGTTGGPSMQRPDFMFPWPFAGGAGAAGGGVVNPGLIPGNPGFIPGMPPLGGVGGPAGGPGLIPSGAPFFPPFPLHGQHQQRLAHFAGDATGSNAGMPPDAMPFDLQPGGDFQRMKRPRYDDGSLAHDGQRSSMATGGGAAAAGSLPMANPSMCNVAPLVPPSLIAEQQTPRRVYADEVDDDDDLQFVSTTPAPQPPPAKAPKRPKTPANKTTTAALLSPNANKTISNQPKKFDDTNAPQSIPHQLPSFIPPLASMSTTTTTSTPMPMPTLMPLESSAASKRRRSATPPAPKTPTISTPNPTPSALPATPSPMSKPAAIIDLDVQSISDDELPPYDDDDDDSGDSGDDDMMDLEEPSATQTQTPADGNADGSTAVSAKKLSKLERRKEKELRKEGRKEAKDGARLKKKKDKKDKNKNKDKSEKRKDKEEKRREKELKERAKKEKKEKKRLQLAAADGGGGGGGGAAATTTQPGFGADLGTVGPSVVLATHHHRLVASSEAHTEVGAVPKLTLKLGASPRPNTPDSHRKITIKPPKKDAALAFSPPSQKLPMPNEEQPREPSPELARFSALVTRPPKQKTPSTKRKDDDIRPSTSSTADFIASSSMTPSTDVGANFPKDPAHHPMAATTSALGFGPTKAASDVSSLAGTSSFSPLTAAVAMPPTQVAPLQRKMNPPGGSVDGKSSKMKAPKSGLAGSVAGDTKGGGGSGSGGPHSGCGGVSASATGVQDSEGNQVWICPACGRVDDGTPMIGCDGCDAWYHWVCVGIQVPPDANEDWYCRVCIAKKQEQAIGGGDKKKKRKKKDKREH